MTGWRVGAQTLAAVQAVRQAAQLGLADAKRMVDDVLGGTPVVFDVGDAKSAQELVSALDRLKFDAQLVSH